MTRCAFLLVAAAVVASGAEARAGGPPPVYVVVDEVVLEPSGGDAERIKIRGSFVRLEDREKYKYGKPVEGYVYLSLGDKAKETRAEWAKWQKAAGTGKVVAVGSCGEAGTFLTAPIHKLGEKAEKPDAAYEPGHLGSRGSVYAESGSERHAPVRDLLAFVKARDEAAKTTSRR